MYDPTDGCPDCGTLDSHHAEDCGHLQRQAEGDASDAEEAGGTAAILELVRDYGRRMEHIGALPSSRHAARAGDFQREADAVLAEIERLVKTIGGDL